MSAPSLEWKQCIAETLQEAKIIPLWGNPPPFPWEQLASLLAQEWNLSGLKIKCEKVFWSEKDHALQGLKQQPIIIPLEATALEGCAYWAISKEEMIHLSGAVLQPSSSKEKPDASLARGFYQFLMLQALSAFSETKAYPDLHIQMGEEQTLPQTSFLVCNIVCSWDNGSIHGKLLVSRSFLASFRNLYRVEPISLLESETITTLSLLLRLVVGRSTLPLSQWKGAASGDFLKLDNCTLSPREKRGRARFFLEQTPLFDVMIKKGKVTLLDYAFYQEEAMEDDEIDEKGEQLDEDDEKFFPDEELNETMVGEESEENVSAETEEPFEEEEETSSPIAQTPKGSEDLQRIIASGEIPITLVVEVARLRMNLKQLLQLHPGNVLELAIPSDMSVRLCSDGKCVATGELIALGETAGVKIIRIHGS